jgi:hypothetical protein
MNDLRMELKVCEGCGALWVRPARAPGVYCRGCTGKLAEFPDALGRRTPRAAARIQGTEAVHRSGLPANRFRVMQGGAR